MDIASLQKQLSQNTTDGSTSLPPVDKWDPAFCGNMNLVIKRNGQWWHEGTPFTRAPLIKLFSSVLKKEGEDYFLVTPVEKIGITVEDVPFVIIDDQLSDDGIDVITGCGDRVRIGKDHPIELRHVDDGTESTKVPYCLIRRNLWARVHQNVLYRWVEHAYEVQDQGKKALALKSGDYEYVIGHY